MDIKSLTLGEVAKAEELAGAPLGWLGDDNKPQGKLMAAVAFVIKRREDNKFTFAQALDMTFDDLDSIIGEQPNELDPKSK